MNHYWQNQKALMNPSVETDGTLRFDLGICPNHYVAADFAKGLFAGIIASS